MSQSSEDINEEQKEDEVFPPSLNFGREVVDLAKEFLKDTNLKEVIDSINSGKSRSIEFEDESSKRNLTFWQWKFVKEFLTIGIILSAIFILSNRDLIDSCTVGTLLGSVIGYALGNFNSFGKRND